MNNILTILRFIFIIDLFNIHFCQIKQKGMNVNCAFCSYISYQSLGNHVKTESRELHKDYEI